MYIAIIADNIATRKHMERLLNRTSDEMMKQTGNLYIESYGDPESMWPLIKRYDLFFLDITQDEQLKQDVLHRLTELGLSSRTVICQQQDTDFSYWPAEHGYLSVQHPLSIPILSKVVLDIHSVMEQEHAAQKNIELRGEKETVYVDSDHVMYAVQSGHLVDVHLENGTIVKMLGSLADFYRLIEKFEDYEIYNNEVIANKSFVTKKEGRTITLSNQQTVKLSLLRKKSLF